MRRYFLFFLLAFAFPALGQQTIFTVKDLYTQMERYHPIVAQTNTFGNIADLEVRIARGNFDPKLQGVYETKALSNTWYYEYQDYALKVPFKIGELKAGYELNAGDRINPENKSPKGGLPYLGVAIPLGQGFLIDARRNTLQQARYFRNIAEADQIKEANKLFLEATKDYWNWYYYYYETRILEEATRLALERYQATKNRVELGDLPGLDSIQAVTLVQERQAELNQARIDLVNASLILSNSLWAENLTIAELPQNAAPQQFSQQEMYLDPTVLQQYLQLARQNHPEIIKLNFKLKQLDVERRFQQDRFKPQIILNYNFLNPSGTNFNGEFVDQPFRNNYKIGVDFQFPLFLRKETGKVQQTRIKIDQTRFEQAQVTRDILTEVETSYNQLIALQQNIELYESYVRNYQALRDGEVQRFNNGEGDLFKINAFETKLLEAQIKLLAFKSKYAKQKATLRWAAGQKLWESN